MVLLECLLYKEFSNNNCLSGVDMKRLLSILFLLSVVFLSAQDSYGFIIYDNGFRNFNAISASDYQFRNRAGFTGIQKGDDFRISETARVTGITWYGVYFDNGAAGGPRDHTPPEADNFTFRFFNTSSQGVPQTNPFFGTQSSNVTRKFSGRFWNNDHTYRIFKYSFLLPGVEFTPDSYFLSIVNNTTTSKAEWWWKDSSDFNDNEQTNFTREKDLDAWSKGVGRHHELSFTLFGGDKPFGAVVKAPNAPKLVSAPRIPRSPLAPNQPNLPQQPVSPNSPKLTNDGDIPAIVNPEPATLFLFSFGLAGSFIRRKF